MKLIVKKTNSLNGIIQIPGSKSQSIRALIIALLSKGQTQLNNLLTSDDTAHAETVCQKLGAKISNNADVVTVESQGVPLDSHSTELNSGNSGITTCFIFPVLGLRKNAEQPIILDCKEQMRKRPIQSLIRALENLGLKIEYVNSDDALPVRVSGKLVGGKAEVDGSNSQYLSALLLSLPCAPNDSEIRVCELQERPYVDLTLSWLNKHNIHYSHQQSENWDTYYIKGGQQYQPLNALISGDYSSASYAIAAAAMLPGKVVIGGLDKNDQQGDMRLIEILKAMGADICIEQNRLIIQGGKPLQGMKIDASDIPDLLPTLAVIGTYANGKTEIINVGHARIKETDRIESMSKGLMALGAKLKECDDGMTIWKSELKGALVDGYDDHRTVMALSIAGLLADGVTTISTAEAINKTYPAYIDSMKTISADMRLIDD